MITRTLNEIIIRFRPDGTPLLQFTSIVTDTDLGIGAGSTVNSDNEEALALAASLRDSIMAASESAGEPLTIQGVML